MILTDLMWHDNEFYFLVGVGIMIYFFFIFRPCAACYYYRHISCEFADHVHLLKIFGNVGHPVESCIAANRNISNTYIIKKFDRSLILNKQPCKATQHFSVKRAIPFKKRMPAVKYCRYQQKGC